MSNDTSVGTTRRWKSQVVDIEDFFEWDQLARRRGWTDGLVVAPPTERRVGELMDALESGPDDFGRVPPEGGLLDREQLAIHCAMAGCLPEHMPVVTAAVQALMEPEFNLYGVQCTTNPCAPLVIVSGPVAAELGFHTREGAFGGGSHASAAVGRAVRLVLWSVGRGLPGQPDMSPLGHPGKYAFCVGETATDSPWRPIHTDFAQPDDASCVTVFACQSPDALLAPGPAEKILAVLRETLPTPGVNMFHNAGQYLLTLNPRVAAELANGGFDRDGLRTWLFENARFRVDRLRAAGLLERGEALNTYWGWSSDCGVDLEQVGDNDELPMVKGVADIHLLVTGGWGQWWAGFSAGWGAYGGYARCRRIEC